ncbi:MAG: cytochrome-c peroxidase [Bacteroidetes bacterium]|nr:cytochrome-c peroxidase [Bacteroidota bacterium]
MKNLLFFIICACLLTQCSDETISPDAYEAIVLNKRLNLPSTPFNYAVLNLPSFFQSEFIKISDNTPADNPVSDQGATLGRVLFYDKNLSINRTIACASCHIQKFGFSDTATLSLGFEGGKTHRHSMGLANAKYYVSGRFFWDERAATLEDQVLMPIQDKLEMGMDIDSLVKRLYAIDYYRILFKRAFGDSVVTKQRISKSLAQFVRSMVSYRSKYDQGRALVNKDLDSFPNFTSLENRGKRIFFTAQPTSCASCHNTNAFIGDNPRNNGLRDNQDEGVQIVTKSPFDFGKFKTPSLKNIAVRPPYMHDGRFQSLYEVINHYTTGIQYSESLDNHLKLNGSPDFIKISLEDRDALVSFLEALTDHEMLKDEKFSNPFK